MVPQQNHLEHHRNILLYSNIVFEFIKLKMQLPSCVVSY